MPELKEIDYGVLIDRLIGDFAPVKRLWPAGLRLLLWILLITAILVAGVLLNGGAEALPLIAGGYCINVAGFFLISIAAAWIALRNSIPGRETSIAELTALAIGVVAAAMMTQSKAPAPTLPALNDLPVTVGWQWSLAALPGTALFWAARRAVPLRPLLTGGLIGVAASCFAITAGLFFRPDYPIIWELVSGAVLIMLASAAGASWLDPQRLWRRKSAETADCRRIAAWFRAEVIFPAAATAAAGLLLFVLQTASGIGRPIPDFDLAINNYQRAMRDFHPNVPSKSIETVLTAYIEDGMPSYMWDFGLQGFKLAGGRFEHLADGTPVTYTWFRGPHAGVMCMFRQVGGFKAPPTIHAERDHLLFYRYRGYSVCLFNVGGYGDFISVIVAPMPLKPFKHMVLSALSMERQ
jgi:hypothetical protein